MLAPVCSSWVWMNRHTSGRSIERPLGNVCRGYIKNANRMVSRVALLCLLLTAKGVFWILEQPKGSLLEHHPRMQLLARRFNLWRCAFPMGNFNAESRKDTWCYSFHSCIMHLPKYATCKFEATTTECEISVVHMREDGTAAVSGGKDLKNSQHYPEEFGAAITHLYFEHAKSIKAEFKAFRSEVEHADAFKNIWSAATGRDQVWRDAGIKKVMNFLQKK